MSKSVNRVTLVGHVGSLPILGESKTEKSVTNFSVATNTNWKSKNGEKREETEWHSIVVWGALAEIVCKYVKKGAQIYIEGYLKTRKWESDRGTHYKTEIIANEVVMLAKKEGV